MVIRIPLSVHQQARFASLRDEIARLVDRKNESVTTIIAQSHDPAQFASWSIALTDDAIVCTSPETA